MKAMILAAGFGKRMLPLTATTPKPLLKVNDRALIEYPILQLARIGITDIVINHAYLGQQIVDYLGDGSRYGVSIHYSAEHAPLETAGGIVKALPLLGDEPFLLINGDIFSDFEFDRLKRFVLQGLGHLILVNNPEHHPTGDFSLADNGFLESDSPSLPAYTYSGMALLSPHIFSRYAVSSGPLAPLLQLAIADQQLTAERHQGLWFDVGTPERLEEVDRLVRKGV